MAIVDTERTLLNLESGHQTCEQNEAPLGARSVEHKKFISDILLLLCAYQSISLYPIEVIQPINHTWYSPSQEATRTHSLPVLSTINAWRNKTPFDGDSSHEVVAARHQLVAVGRSILPDRLTLRHATLVWHVSLFRGHRRYIQHLTKPIGSGSNDRHKLDGDDNDLTQ